MKYVHLGLFLLHIIFGTAQCQNDSVVAKREIDERKDEDDAERKIRGAFTEWFLQQKGIVVESEEHFVKGDEHEHELEPHLKHENNEKKLKKSKFLTHWCDWFGLHNHSAQALKLCSRGPLKNETNIEAHVEPDDNLEEPLDEPKHSLSLVDGDQNVSDPLEHLRHEPQLNDVLNNSREGDTESTSYQRIVVIHKIKQTTKEASGSGENT